MPSGSKTQKIQEPESLDWSKNDYQLAKKGLVGVKISSRQSLALDNASAFLKVDLALV